MTQIYQSGPPTAPAAALDLEALDSPAFLVNGDDRRELTGDRAVIGRSRECDIQVADPNVSRQHAELRREGGGFVIVDLGSTNGIEVNGRKVKRASLDTGDRISIGQTDLIFEREP
jgi:pSer/pThr/pTyr-binding forkhead associated (FHA) protein